MSLAPDPVVLDVSPEGVAVVMLNKPAKHNAVDEVMIAQLREAFETLKGADHVRVVFLRGAGETFSAGADPDWLRRQGERTLDDNEKDALEFARMLKALHDLPRLTVALIDGAAMGAGAGLVAASDWAVATARAHFRFADVRFGVTPAAISPYVVEAVGVRTARGLFASALPFDAETAKQIGLIHELAADAGALDSAMKRIAGLALENAPGAASAAKQLARHVAAHPFDDRLVKETAKRAAQARASPEGREGLAAFLEKRKPEWDR